MWFRRRGYPHILVWHRSADRSRDGDDALIMKTRRIIGFSIVATGFIWFQVAGQLEANRIQAQRQTRPATQSQPVSLRIDSERLMSTVTTMADPKWEGRAAGSPGGIAARAYVV